MNPKNKTGLNALSALVLLNKPSEEQDLHVPLLVLEELREVRFAVSLNK